MNACTNITEKGFFLNVGVLCLSFCFVIVVFLLFVQNHIISLKMLQFLLQCKYIEYT